MGVSKKREVPQWREAVAGAGAGAFSKTAMAPVERVKLLLQLQHQAKELVNEQKSALQVAKDVYRSEGFLSFWRGNLPNVWRTAGTAAVNFTCMDYYKRVAVGPWLESGLIRKGSVSEEAKERRKNFLTSLISGGMAGGTATTLLYPLEFARTRLAMDLGRSQQRQYTGLMDVFISIWKLDGVRGFYQGYGIALTGGIFYRILFLGGYDTLKAEIMYLKENGKITWSERYLAAQAISLTAGTLSYPFDTVRRRLMMQAGEPQGERRYSGSIDCILKVARTEGIRGFYLGLAPNLLRSIGGALLLVAYDSIKAFL